jgi:hypothetical protein
MNGQDTLPRLAQLAIANGDVPTHRPAKLWGTSGDGSICPICRTAISTQELAYELEFVKNPGESQRTCYLHARCFKVWDEVRDASNRAGPLATDPSIGANQS